jgi:hypothetical protein
MAGFVLLGGLFFYDIFFVFGTKIMVTVAVSMDVPIKVSTPILVTPLLHPPFLYYPLFTSFPFH